MAEKKVSEFSLEALMNPQLSKVSKSTRGVVMTFYGGGGLGKTPVATQMEYPYYLAFGKSGLSGLNNVPFKPIRKWAEFLQFINTFCDPKNVDTIYDNNVCHTLILDELEVLYGYCEKYVAAAEGVNKIKEGNGGYGLWADLKTEWENAMLKVIGSGYCVVFILHCVPDKNGRMFPVGDEKRMLPILLNHSEIIGYVRGNGVNPETGRPIHSSLMLAGTDEYFARTRNDYFDPMVEDFTAKNVVKAYYDALDRQEKAEGTQAISREERNAMFENTETNFDDLMSELEEVGTAIVEKYGNKDPLTEVVERHLGAGAMVMKCTPKQKEQVEIILSELKALL